MKIDIESSKNCLTVKYEFGESEIAIINHIRNFGNLMFKSYESDCLDVTDNFHRSETLQLISNGLIEHDLMCYETTYKLTELGERFENVERDHLQPQTV